MDKADLVEAYLATNFEVITDPPFTLNVGKESKELLDLFQSDKCQDAAFITAWNPYSQPTSQTDNDAAQARLILELENDGYKTLEGMGVDPTGEWPGEPSILVLGLSKNDAIIVATSFNQNAIICIGMNGIPELVTLWDE